jgi:hydroxymethylpyrimidine/phosphomethylpyrimidine kinase
VIKGGHLEGEKAIDVLYMGGDEFHYFVRDKVKSRNTHGTGCTFSSAIAVFLGRGYGLKEAVGRAKEYVQRAIETAPSLGKGHGPLNHLWNIEPCVREF